MRPGDPSPNHEPPAAVRAITAVELDFPTLFDDYYDRIAAYLSRRLMDRSVAEDLAQLTFLEAFDRRATYDHRKGSPRVWLFGIATNLLHHHFRAERSQLRAFSRAASREVEAADHRAETHSRLDWHAMSGQIAAALATLRPGDYDVLTLHCWADLSHKEIASALKLKEGTVKSRLNRARRQMRLQLNPSILETNDG
jgi:RNA polymerase sigma factor (sigma-70 family)